MESGGVAATVQVQSKVSSGTELTTLSSEQEVIGLLLQQNGNVVTLAPQVSAGVEAMETDVSGLTTVTMSQQQVEHMVEPSPTNLDATQTVAAVQDQGMTLVDTGSGQQIMTLTEGQSVQTIRVSLPDGSSALLSHPALKDEKIMEGQTVQLEDGTTAVVQSLTPKKDPEPLPKFVEGQAIQLEDGTMAYIQNTNKDGFQAVQLEDGTTAYIAHTGTEGLFNENAQLDPATLAQLDQLTQNGLVHSPTRMSSERALALGDKAYRCNYEGCGRLYTTQHHLKVHERSHTGDRPFKCKYPNCGKAFATGYGLKSHTRVHTGEKPYRCPEEACDKAFKTSGDLQKHVRTHTGERPFKCPFEGCERSFTTSNIRKVHIRTHTGERPYICEEDGCNKAFASATNYKNHIRIHTGEKPYVCTVQGCGKRFTEYSSLYKHHVVHTHSKPYVCNHCGKNYRQTSTLAMHKRTAHGEETAAEGDAALLMQGDDQCLCLPSNGQGESPMKRIQLQFTPTVQAPEQTTEEGEGTLVINTSEAQQVTMVAENQAMAGFSQEAAQAALQQLTSGQGLTLADGDGQHIYVVTDPAQLEALQLLAQQQLLPQVESQPAEIAIQQEDRTTNT